MLSEKGYRDAQVTKKTVKAIEAKLKEYKINYEPIDYDLSFTYSVGYTILTDNCTIEVYKDQITVNEKPVADINEMIEMVVKIEVN